MQHDPRRQPTDGASAFQLFQAVSNPGETGNPLIRMMKLPAVSPFHGFGEHRPRNFNRDRPADLKIPRRPSPENGETAKRTAIYPTISDTCLFHPGLKRPETANSAHRTGEPTHANHRSSKAPAQAAA